jgi:hypothetical protein
MRFIDEKLPAAKTKSANNNTEKNFQVFEVFYYNGSYKNVIFNF